MAVTKEDAERYRDTWKERNPDKARESHRKAQLKWRAKNRERVRDNQRKWNATNRDKANLYRKRTHHKNKYGITLEQREELFTSQGKRCKCCGSFEPGNKIGWVIDHNHKHGTVRGILCHNCNLALGFVRDNIKHLQRLIMYLEDHDAVD